MKRAMKRALARKRYARKLAANAREQNFRMERGMIMSFTMTGGNDESAIA